jgi:hypothetical protein
MKGNAVLSEIALLFLLILLELEFHVVTLLSTAIRLDPQSVFSTGRNNKSAAQTGKRD